jgi:hypothetical protein
MSYGKVISGGKQMSKGLTKGINDKLAGFEGENKRRAIVAGAVRKAFTQNPLSDNHTNNVNGGKFTTPKLPAKV